MDLRLARLLPICGMFVTVSALIVGGHGLGSAPVSASASSSSTPNSSPDTSSASTAPAGSSPITVSSTPVAGSTTQFSYLAGDAATLVIDTAGGAMRLVTFAPHPGWFTVRLDQPTATQLTVLLESTNGRIRFAAEFVNGVVVAELEGPTGPGASVPGSSAPGTSAPGNSAPDNSTPGGDDNGGNSGPGGGGDD
jgi:hypothetical protein